MDWNARKFVFWAGIANSGFDRGYLLDATPPKKLYHYTTLEGAIGILKSKTLWASNAVYLNDASEVSHTFAVARKLLGESAEYRESGLIRLVGEVEYLATKMYYVACLSTESDDLSQWRAYGGGAGVCLGFDIAGFERKFLRKSLVECEYDESRLEEKVRAVLASVLAEVRAKRSPWDRPIAEMAAVHPPLSDLALLCIENKHPAFRAENEYRLVLTPSEGMTVSVRSRCGLLIPYVSYPLGEAGGLRLTDAVVGPSPQMQLSAEALLLSKSGLGHDDLDVSVSEVPYRPQL